MDEAQLLWAVGSLQRRLRTVEEQRLAAAAAFAERQAVVDALQARCLTRIWGPSASQTLLLHAHVIQHAAPVAEPGVPSARLWWTRCRLAA